MKIEYIFHSGFTVETDNYFLVFDYYKGKINLREDKRTVVFSSHNHGDHLVLCQLVLVKKILISFTTE
jgi:L-ascorbate metabolism protein UlaG (beta-lactamase superfamily)